MDTTKVTGFVRISGGQITIDEMSLDGKEIEEKINKLLALRDVVQKGLENFEKETQSDFKNLPKIANQIDLCDSIFELEQERAHQERIKKYRHEH